MTRADLATQARPPKIAAFPALAVVMRIALAMLALALAAPAAAQEAARFTLHPTENGFVRLDGETGAVSECVREAGGLRCRSTPDERAALQAEIDRLAQENARLRSGLVTDEGDGEALPDDAEFERALDLMERFMRRFGAIAGDLERESGGAGPRE